MSKIICTYMLNRGVAQRRKEKYQDNQENVFYGIRSVLTYKFAAHVLVEGQNAGAGV